MAIFTARSADYTAPGEDQGDEWHQQHATADAEQARQKTGAQTQQGQFCDQKGFKNHVGGLPAQR
jgi:hypothetical protein